MFNVNQRRRYRAGVKSLACALAVLAFAGPIAHADTAAAPPPATDDKSFETAIVAEIPLYKPEQSVSGTIRLWGHGNAKLPWMKHLVETWEAGFQRYQPGIHVQYEMHGTSSAIPALLLGVGDMAILGEEIDPVAVAAFEKIKHYKPTVVELLTGALDVRNFDYAQMFYVRKDNPLSQITLAQLDAIYGQEHRRGSENIRNWGQLGLTGAMASQPIHPYGWAIDDSFGIYLQQYLLENSHRWNSDLQQYIHINRPDGTIYDHGQQILDALAKDPDGIAVSNIRYAGPEVKALALGATAAGPFYQATKETLVRRTYPLARIIPAIIDLPPGQTLDPKVKEFLRYILSREGQQATVDDGRYLPITKEAVAEQLGKLK